MKLNVIKILFFLFALTSCSSNEKRALQLIEEFCNRNFDNPIKLAEESIKLRKECLIDSIDYFVKFKNRIENTNFELAHECVELIQEKNKSINELYDFYQKEQVEYLLSSRESMLGYFRFGEYEDDLYRYAMINNNKLSNWYKITKFNEGYNFKQNMKDNLLNISNEFYSDIQKYKINESLEYAELNKLACDYNLILEDYTNWIDGVDCANELQELLYRRYQKIESEFLKSATAQNILSSTQMAILEKIFVKLKLDYQMVKIVIEKNNKNRIIQNIDNIKKIIK